MNTGIVCCVTCGEFGRDCVCPPGSERRSVKTELFSFQVGDRYEIQEAVVVKIGSKPCAMRMYPTGGGDGVVAAGDELHVRAALWLLTLGDKPVHEVRS